MVLEIWTCIGKELVNAFKKTFYLNTKYNFK